MNPAPSLALERSSCPITPTSCPIGSRATHSSSCTSSIRRRIVRAHTAYASTNAMPSYAGDRAVVALAGLDVDEGLAGLDQGAIGGDDLTHRAGDVGGDLVEHLHRLNQAHNGVRLDVAAHL